MKRIALTKGQFTLVDNEDFERLSAFKWYAMETKVGDFYAYRKVRLTKSKHGCTISMSRFILQATNGMLVDHKNGNTLDNQKHNLRLCKRGENNCNRPKNKRNTSGFKGVFSKRNKWRSAIGHDGIVTRLGTFATKREASEAYNKATLKYHKSFSYLKR